MKVIERASMIRELLSLVVEEKKLAVKEVYRNAHLVPSRIYTLGRTHLINCDTQIGQFELGDTVGAWYNEFVNLGFVVDRYRDVLVVYSPSPSNSIAFENEDVPVFRSENMIGYDLQIGLLSRLIRGDVDPLETMASEIVFSKVPLPAIRRKKKKIIGIGLDEFQKDAVEAILGLEDGEFLLIVGPPGTGKTRVISRAALELADQGERVLITSHTNRAVDTALERLHPSLAVRVGWPEKVSESMQDFLLETKARKKLGDRLRRIDREIERIKKNIERRKKGGWGRSFLRGALDLLYCERMELLKKAEEDIIIDSKIVGTTLIKSNLWPVSLFDFDTVLIDESSQVSISLALLGMIKARKYVLVGDHHQLLPVLRSARDARRYSAFIYLKSRYPHRVRWLRRHYRSNSKIAYLSSFFYEEEIQPDESCERVVLKTVGNVPDVLSPDKPVVFVSVDGEEERVNESKVNILEARACELLVEELVKAGVPEREIVCISPFRAQVELLREILGRAVEVGTVDSFQGREKDVVIFSVTATRNFRFAADPNRLNVAFSRARKKLIVVGNGGEIMLRGGVLKGFLEFCADEKAVFFARGGGFG